MKHIISETKINKSNRSLISTIPNTIVSLEGLSNKDSIRWSYEIVDNKHQYTIEFVKNIKKQTVTKENTENTPRNIDETTQKQTKKQEDKIISTTTTKNNKYDIILQYNPHKQIYHFPAS